MGTKQNTVSAKWAVVTLCIAAVLVGVSVAALSFRPEKKAVTNFDECIAAGGARMESYPEQCLYEGRTYMDGNQQAPAEPIGSGENYVGMTEDDALTLAEKSKTPARVVERDGESLPVTMDFIYGRHNLYIRDGAVYKVEIEGEATDTPMMAE